MKKLEMAISDITGCGKNPWTKIKFEFTRSLNGYS